MFQNNINVCRHPIISGFVWFCGNSPAIIIKMDSFRPFYGLKMAVGTSEVVSLIIVALNMSQYNIHICRNPIILAGPRIIAVYLLLLRQMLISPPQLPNQLKKQTWHRTSLSINLLTAKHISLNTQ